MLIKKKCTVIRSYFQYLGFVAYKKEVHTELEVISNVPTELPSESEAMATCKPIICILYNHAQTYLLFSQVGHNSSHYHEFLSEFEYDQAGIMNIEHNFCNMKCNTVGELVAARE